MQNNSIRSALNIPGYKVIKVEKNATRYDIWIEAYKRNKGKCSGCGAIHQKGYHSKRCICVEDLRIGARKVFLHLNKRRYRCPEDRRIHTEDIEWLDIGVRVTKAFAKQVNRLTAITTNQEAGWYLDMNDERVYRIDKVELQRQFDAKLRPPPAAKNMSVDEVSYLKYHRYITNVVDVDIRKVIWNSRGRKKEVLDKYYEGIGSRQCAEIQTVALDGARTYISSTKEYAVNALMVYDRFHVTQKVNNAIDQVRKDQLSQARTKADKHLIELTNCKQRFILLKRRSRLTDRQAMTLEKLCVINEPIYKALLLKEQFLEVYNCKNEEDAKAHLIEWFTEALDSKIAAFVELAVRLVDKVVYILNWFKKRISSAISEGINNKIKRLKRMAYGYKDIDYLLLKIHQHCGLLNPKDAT